MQSADENKFGLKLLEKMGWKKGSGLGKDGQGNPELIRVSFKSDTKGVGWEDKASDVWKESNFQYEQLLQELNRQHKVQNSESTSNADKDSVPSSDNTLETLEGSGDTLDARSTKKLKLKRMEKTSKKLKKRIQ